MARSAVPLRTYDEMSARHEEIFAAARRLPAAERESYLAEQCETEDERERVNLLLEKSTRADAFFGAIEEPQHVTEASVIEEIGDRIGPYTLVKELGDGGFGIVFEAEQTEPIARTVALKIIKQGMDTRQVIRRFETERQTLAMMEHPNIARVIDAGATATGRPYFAMELVEGEPITGFCKGHELNLRQRLDLFLDVCAAVSHAHQKGIIHRDLKPSNILVAAEGEKAVVKVIDFGIAKALEEQAGDGTLLTRAEQFIGTPLYVSPEQAASTSGAADTRSDVYSLGVILYELLTGSTPFDSDQLANKSHDEIRRIVREEDPPKPSTRLSKLPADLDWIVLKAIEKDRERRYESPIALAQDIRNHLTDQPVSAAAPSMSYRLGKLLKRHRTAFGAAAVVLLALVVGLGVSITALIREKEARADEAKMRLRAESSEKSAKQISALLQDVLGSIDPAVAQGLDTTLMESVVDTMVERIESDIPPGSIEGVELRLTAGKVFVALGQSQKAKLILDTALGGARRIDDNARAVKILLVLAMAETLAGENKKRAEYLREAVRLGEQTHPVGHPDTLVAKARLTHTQGGIRGAQVAKEAQELAAKFLEEDDPAYATVFSNFYVATRGFRSRAENLEILRKVVHVFRPRSGEADPQWARTLSLLAHSLSVLGELENRSDYLTEAIEVAEKADRHLRDLHQPGYVWRVVGRWRLAMVHLAAGDLGAARITWLEALKEQRETGRQELQPARLARLELAWMFAVRGCREEALELATALRDNGVLLNWMRRYWVDLSMSRNHWKLAGTELSHLTGDSAHEDEHSTTDWMKLGALHLHRSEKAAFKIICKRMVEKISKTQLTISFGKTAELYFATPLEPGSPLTQEALEMARKSAREASNHLGLGMAMYRIGDYTKALSSLDEANRRIVSMNGDWTNPVIVKIDAYRAMTAHQLGKSELAESYLSASENLADQLQHGLRLDWQSSWHDRVLARLAVDEARDLIR